MFNIMETP